MKIEDLNLKIFDRIRKINKLQLIMFKTQN